MAYAPTLAARLRLYAAFLNADPDRQTLESIAKTLTAIAADLEEPPHYALPDFRPPLLPQSKENLR